MLVKDIMRKKVIYATPEVTMRDASRIMADNHVGSIVVKKAGKVVGIVTEHDILSAIGMNTDPAIEISQIMTNYLITVSPGSSIEHAASVMMENKIKKLIVLDGIDLAGIITATDIMEAEPGMAKALVHLKAK